MKKLKELLKSQNYWLTKIQNDLFRQLNEFMVQNTLKKTDIADKLGVSKGYVSQVMNGNFNFTLKKLIELSLLFDKVPDIKFISSEEYYNKYLNKRSEYIFNYKISPFYKFEINNECNQYKTPTNNKLVYDDNNNRLNTPNTSNLKLVS